MDAASNGTGPPTGGSQSLIPLDGDAQKRELRAFLMSRRARLKPGDVGLPATGRRRAPGLRREEVAALAGVSTAWYTMFEMAKETRVSRKTLDAIAAALKLSPSEIRHLWVLADAALPGRAERAPYVADPVISAILEGYRLGPALLLNDRTDVLAMNDIAVALFGEVSQAAGYERNWLWLLFADQLRVANWEEQARELAAQFRATYCEHAQDPDYNALLEELLRTSEPFRRYWFEHEVALPEEARPFILGHPIFGELHFALRALPVTAEAHARCCFLVPNETTLQLPAYRELLRSLG